jgi:WD40 repeat protein
MIKILDIGTGIELHSYKTCGRESGHAVVAQIDPSGLFVATSTSDRRLRVHNLYTGECVAIGVGHSDALSAIKFLPDSLHLVSSAQDGCIMIWKLPAELTAAMTQRFRDMPVNAGSSATVTQSAIIAELLLASDSSSHASFHVPFDCDLRLLPTWAKKQVHSSFASSIHS